LFARWAVINDQIVGLPGQHVYADILKSAKPVCDSQGQAHQP
jgi:hypothetical protein